MMTLKFSKKYRIWLQTRQQTLFKSVTENKVKVHMQQTEFAAGYQSVKLLKDFIRPLQKTGNATEQNDRGKNPGGNF